MRVLALIEAPNHVCYRYRLQAFAWPLAMRGMQIEAAPLSRNPVTRVRQLRGASRADLVILQRKLLPLWQLLLLRRHARRLVFDFDDALFCRDSFSTKRGPSQTRLAHFWATIYAADLVLAGNDFLLRQTQRFIEPQRVCHVPTCIEPARYPMALHRSDHRPRLAWIGQKSTLACLPRAEPLLAEANRYLPGMRLRVICDRFPAMREVDIEPVTWSEQTEAQHLAECDIGISWLPDDQWSRGKCGLKVLQYMAAGLPVVANPVGMNRTMVQHGRTGFLCETPSEWSQAIQRLASDPNLRRQMGAAGRARVESKFSTASWAERVADLLLGLPSSESNRSELATAERAVA